MAFHPRGAALFGAAIVPVLWAGAIVGVSFISTPIKFSSPELTMPAAIDVGRVTFHFFNRVELVFAALTLAFAFLAPAGRVARGICLLACAILLAQTFWLLPVLEARSVAYVAGEPMPPTWHHSLFGAGEVAKVLLLLVMSGFAMKAGRAG